MEHPTKKYGPRLKGVAQKCFARQKSGISGNCKNGRCNRCFNEKCTHNCTGKGHL